MYFLRFKWKCVRFLITLISGVLCLVAAAVSKTKDGHSSSYKFYSFEELCNSDGSKKEIYIGYGAIILTFDSSKLATKELFMCHLEIEVAMFLGFHVYIDEMNFGGNDERGNCPDYVQFGRDVLYFTTHRSKRYCGRRNKINFNSTSGILTHWRRQKFNQDFKSRFYVEEKDTEMDIWLQVLPNDDHKNITMVITAFKNHCSRNDVSFRQCRHSNHCVKKVYFCDNYANCAWPAGDYATDEQKCEVYGRYSGDSMGRSSKVATHIILIVVGVILCIVISVSSFVFLRHLFCRIRNKDNERQTLSNVPSRRNSINFHAADRGRSGEAETSSLVTHHMVEVHSEQLIPSAPPSYEEAIKVSSNEDRNFQLPPAYTEESNL